MARDYWTMVACVEKFDLIFWAINWVLVVFVVFMVYAGWSQMTTWRKYGEAIGSGLMVLGLLFPYFESAVFRNFFVLMSMLGCVVFFSVGLRERVKRRNATWSTRDPQIKGK
ncbi:hypothetical protein [Diaphorobacter caeni]|uniref:hypothetical protein n=1 Tax=Diaphorobacter caeni TaxID=2784387 RepID=UPI00188FE7CF|nr:hypothetical protein [Diaphorobacter caeni]MBF5007795.1 hypothetical protein [Diaphorobacter caeni]